MSNEKNFRKLKDTLTLPTLIRYKTETDLNEFNKNRPNGLLDSIGQFKDARFYTTSNNDSIGKIEEKLTQIVEPTTKEVKSSLIKEIPINSSLWKLHCDQYEDRIKYLEEQLKGVYEQLEIQTQINIELKKLFSQSICDDIQYKIERLVSDKQRFQYEIDSNQLRMAKLTENIEQISIECDLWRSKYLACKTFNDELILWKQFLLKLQNDSSSLLNDFVSNENNVNLYTKLRDRTKEFLIQFSWLSQSNLNSIDTLEALLNAFKMQNNIQNEKCFNLFLNCCLNCKGKIKNV